MDKYITHSVKETQKLGRRFAKEISTKKIGKQAVVLELQGDLGSGKTTFIQGLAKGLKIKENILSPTFVILKEFTIKFPASGWPAVGWKNFYHIDAYRLKSAQEILELGFKDLLKNPENLIVVEWADRIKKILPRNALKIRFTNVGKNKRKLFYEATYCN